MDSDLQNSLASPDFVSEGLWGTVVAVQANYYQVKLDSQQNAEDEKLKNQLQSLLPDPRNLNSIPDSLFVYSASRLKNWVSG